MADEKDVTIQQLLAANAALMDRLTKLEARMPPEEAAAPEPGKKLDFPAVVYKRGHKKGQIDHPGNLTQIVGDEAALAVALNDGWQEAPFDHLDLDEAEELAKEMSKSTSKKKKAA